MPSLFHSHSLLMVSCCYYYNLLPRYNKALLIVISYKNLVTVLVESHILFLDHLYMKIAAIYFNVNVHFQGQPFFIDNHLINKLSVVIDNHLINKLSVVFVVEDLPSYNKPSFPSPTSSTQDKIWRKSPCSASSPLVFMLHLSHHCESTLFLFWFRYCFFFLEW